MSRRRFGVTLLSSPSWYLFSEEEIKAVYYNLIKYIKYKYKNKDYDYYILVGMSNVDSKTVDYKIKSNNVGRPKYMFIPKNKNIGIRNVNWHLHIMVCGAPLGIIVRDIEDYLQKILNKKLCNEEFDKKVYDSANFNKYYYMHKCRNELDILLSGLLRKKKKKKERVPKCSLINLNVNRRKTANRKDDFYNIIEYIEKQSILCRVIASKDFKVAYFDIAKELNLLAKKGKAFYYRANKNKAKMKN